MPSKNLRYFKRYRMELDLRFWRLPELSLPADYRLVAWNPSLTSVHADVKYESFRDELDAQLFPCLGEYAGCQRLMEEIECKDGFLPEATWLVQHTTLDGAGQEYCGTIQTIRVHRGRANIQNVGVLPAHRGRGLGRLLLIAAAGVLPHIGVQRLSLEVTAENESAIRLYRDIGFRAVRTLYKAVDTSSMSLLAK